jgi:hypothetical protein
MARPKKIENSDMILTSPDAAPTITSTDGVTEKKAPCICYPPKTLQRNSYGLLTNVDYKFNEQTGLVDWRAMVKPEYLVPNKQRTQETDITKLEDKDLLILLQGIKELAFLRGYTDIHYEIISASNSYCCVNCRITWIQNFETENKIMYFESIGDAHYENTDSFGRNFLASIAENRAFVRCVKNFLRIPVLAKEELGGKVSNTDSSTSNPQVELLQAELDKRNITWSQFKTKLIKDGVDGAESMNELKDLPSDQIFSYIGRIKKAS